MATDSSDLNLGAQALARGGLAHALAKRLGLEPPTPARRLIKVSLLVVVDLASARRSSRRSTGTRGAGSVAIPLLLDPVVHTRFLFVVPLLELAQIFVETSLRVQMRHFLDSGLIPDRQRAEYKAVVAEITRCETRRVVEVVLAVLAVVFSVLIRTVGNVAHRRLELAARWARRSPRPAGGTSWSACPFSTSSCSAGLWLFLLWAWFLFRTSRLDLELTPTHPDRAGGLGFLGWGMASFGLVVLAVSAVLSGSLAREIIHARIVT